MADELIIKAFESIGIPKNQIIIYLDLLKNKESSATSIAKRTKMHRANAYDTLTKLKERNLVFITNKDGKQLFSALSTDLILHQEKDKLEKLKYVADYINTTYVFGQTPRVYTLEGLNPIKNLLFNLLEKEGSEIWIYGLAENDGIINVLNDKLMHSFHLERIKRQLELKLLFSKVPTNEIKTLTGLKYTYTRLLPEVSQSTNSQITQIVCNGFVFITLWLDPVYTIVIENDVISKKYIDFYKILWEASKEIIE